MSRVWDWKTTIFEQTVNKSGSRGPFTGDSPPSFISGALYQGPAGDSRIYLYGGTTSYWNTSFPGWQAPSSSEYGLWSFDTSASTWNQYDISDGSPERPSRGFSAEAPDQGLAFYFNGELDRGSSSSTADLGNNFKTSLPGMIVIDTVAHTSTNVSTSAASGNLPRTRGGMVYIPNYGDRGILVALGGTSKPLEDVDGSDSDGFVSMTEIEVYDINAYFGGYSGWNKQSATGDVPGNRADTCVVVVSTPDNSSHNTYMYGGRGPRNTTYDDVYVLSIPTFT